MTAVRDNNAPSGPDPAPFLTRLRKGSLCAGCGACAALAPGHIAMEMAGPGFLRPRQTGPITAAENARIAAVCPGLGQRVEAAGRRDDPLWGPLIGMVSGWARDPALRFEGASGGALSALLAHLLENREVRGVVQIAADPADPVGNITVVSKTPEDVLRAAGSRYAPSAPLAHLPGGEGPFAFVGKPCDVAALRAMQADDPALKERFPVLVSFFCAGVPSRAGARKVVAALGMAPDGIAAFRYRGRGWPGRATATGSDGAEASMSYFESWGKILSSHVQHRCKICADGTGKAADIVSADAWEADEKGYPLFEEQDGISLIVARTATGQALLEAAEAAGRIATAPFDEASLAAIQPGQSGRRRALLARLAGLLVMGRPVPRYRGLGLWAAARTGSLRRQARDFLGMIRRVLTGRVSPEAGVQHAPEAGR
ncbi:MAG: Coenzyme F420 hydrogenase/dehydrogenase, beta subunit C-terminal domain [Pseudomonadota bacterium]